MQTMRSIIGAHSISWQQMSTREEVYEYPRYVTTPQGLPSSSVYYTVYVWWRGVILSVLSASLDPDGGTAWSASHARKGFLIAPKAFETQNGRMCIQLPSEAYQNYRRIFTNEASAWDPCLPRVNSPSGQKGRSVIYPKREMHEPSDSYQKGSYVSTPSSSIPCLNLCVNVMRCKFQKFDPRKISL